MLTVGSLQKKLLLAAIGTLGSLHYLTTQLLLKPTCYVRCDGQSLVTIFCRVAVPFCYWCVLSEVHKQFSVQVVCILLCPGEWSTLRHELISSSSCLGLTNFSAQFGPYQQACALFDFGANMN